MSESGGDPGLLIEALRGRGAGRFDPVRLRYIEALARRAADHQGGARAILEDRLARRLAEAGERLDQAREQIRETIARAVERFPQAADELEQLCTAGDFSALRRLVARLEDQAQGAALADLLAHIGERPQPSAEPALAARAGEDAEPRGELKSLSYFRSTWSKLGVEQQLAQALAQAPENAGPLNSHLLVLRSLKRMNDLAPDYLKRYMTYVDALLWLEQTDNGYKAAQKSVARGERDKKRKSVRGNAA